MNNEKRTIIPNGYHSILNISETQDALEIIKTEFTNELCKRLNLQKIVAPTIVEVGLGLQDDLSGKERPVEFDAPPAGKNIQVLQDNCKWRRSYLSKHHFPINSGIYATLDAGIRRDEGYLDNTHSLIINNATWEIVIDIKNRNINFLKDCIKEIVESLFGTQQKLKERYPMLPEYISKDVSFISSYELEELYPNLDPDEREYEWCKQFKTSCITHIGYPLKNGKPHGFRSPDYDDWNLNFDLFVFYPPLDKQIEIGGGAIRVMSEELKKQVRIAGWDNKINTPYHKSILDNNLVPTIGGALGSDRIAMIMTSKVHIGEVRPSVWDNETLEECNRNNVNLM